MKRYGPYQSTSGHLFWLDIEGESRHTVLVHREVMEKALGRTLGEDEIVHHKDENKQNNSLDNLELMSRTDHTRHHSKPPELMEVVCVECGGVVQKQARSVRHNQGKQLKAGPFCGRSCAGRFNQRKRVL